MDDKEIIKSILEGNKNDFEKILIKYDKKVYGFICKLIGDKHIAQDLAQETFLKAYRNLYNFDRNKNFITWLFTIAKNTSLNYLKSNESKSFEKIDEEFAHDLTPEVVIENKENMKELYELIHSLPEKYRVLILLKYVEKLTAEDIGKVLNLPKGKVESRLYIARQKLISMRNKNNEKKVKNLCMIKDN
ncbi:RNA polymerase sigma factor [Clostridium sp. Marseille-Q7071]